MSLVSIDRWVNRGPPYLEKDAKGHIKALNFEAFVKWRMSRRDSSSLEKKRIRLIKAQAGYEELKVAQARAEQIPSDVLVMA